MMMEPPSLLPDEFVLYALWQTEHAMRLTINGALTRLGLSLPQFAALAWLGSQSGLSTADLARLNRVSPQNMGAAVDRLCSFGYLERIPPRHGRITELRLTDRGREALRTATAQVAAVEEKMLGHLDDIERAALPDLLRRCRAGLADPV